ncbi:MAG TPA: aminoacyl-tRNA hydrolase [Candidatus Dormibacteraeota bacterium]|nr:aminoacyl-tRNA hydrolase [Candidatus Dormibacteraeota bacterium]
MSTVSPSPIAPSRTLDPATDLVLVGLGNPGAEYAGTRHNIGWACLETFAGRAGIRLTRRRWKARVGCGEVAGRRIWLLEPQTYMNLSGRSVLEATRDLGLGPGSVWVLHDEIDLGLCRLRIRRGGSAAGHNGVRSIIAALHSDEFVRFRVGVGRPPKPGSEAGIRHVLGRFTSAEAAVLPTVLEGVASAVELALTMGLERAMERYNRPGSLGCDELP